MENLEIPLHSYLLMLNYIKDRIKYSDGIFPELSNIAYYKEFCTIKFGLPRRSGHTTIIKKVADEKTLIIVPNFNMSKQFKDCKGKVIVFGEWDYIRGRDINHVMIDCSYILNKENITEIYKNCCGFGRNIIFSFFQ